MRVLLTGAAGFAGSHALRHLLANTDWHIVCLTSFDHHGHPKRIESACKGFDPSRYTIIPADLRQPLTTATRLCIGTVDHIINYASESHVNRSIEDPVTFVQNNVSLMLNMLEFARTLPELESFVQISTDEVYGACQGDPHVEWSPIVPSNPYAASKAAQEAIAVSYWRTYGMPLLLVNCMNMFGELQDEEKFIQMVINRVRARETVTIHSTPSGRPGSRCWIHARNLADGILFLLRHYDDTTIAKYKPAEGVEPKPARYNIVGEEVSNLAMAYKIAGILGETLHYEMTDFHSERPGHDVRYAMDGRKMEDLGWVMPVSLDDSLSKLIDWKTL